MEFVARDDLVGAVNEQTQNCERLVLKFDADSLLPQFTRLQICFEDAETNYSIYVCQVYQIRLQRLPAAGSLAATVLLREMVIPALGNRGITIAGG